jgi:hypothetical protein
MAIAVMALTLTERKYWALREGSFDAFFKPIPKIESAGRGDKGG